MNLLGKATSMTEEERAFLQRRVRSLGLLAGGTYLFFLLYRLGLMWSHDGAYQWAEPSFAHHAAAALSFLLMAALCLPTGRSARWICSVEASCLFLGVLFTAAMGAHIPVAARPDFIVLMALQYTLMARAVLVPSTGWRSLAIAFGVGVVLVAGTYLAFLDPQALPIWRLSLPAGSPLRQATSLQVARYISLDMAAWWLATCVITTATSTVIYGLRCDVRDAKQLGQYHLERKLGEGGMGVVYQARHAMLRRPTAVKLLHKERRGSDSLRRFEAEVQQTARLRHPNIITIFDYGHTLDGVFYYAMEYIDGLTLDAVVACDGAQPVARVVHIWQQVALALVEAHGQGLIHRDVKPSNVMAFLPHRFGGVSEAVKLLDFGLVKEVQSGGGIELTHADSLSGTPQYMAPEVIRAPEHVDARSDIYALGAVAYHLLTGTHVFDGNTVVAVCGHHMHTPPEPPSTRLRAPIPDRVESLLLDCLAKDPAARPSTALTLVRRLETCAKEVGNWQPDAALDWWQRHRAATDAPSSHSASAHSGVHRSVGQSLTVGLRRPA